MHPRSFALIAGIVMLAIGVLSLIPSMTGSMEGLPPLKDITSYGLFMGLLPMNIYNKIALIIFGLAGIAAASAGPTSLPRSIQWSRVVFVVMGILAVLGLFPATNTLNGYWPLFGGEVWAHALFAVLGAYFGYRLTSKVPDSGPAITDFRTPAARPR